MANEVQKYINNDSVQGRIKSLLDKRAGQFTTSLLSAINANKTLSKCKPETVLNAALTAASLNLPINSNLGFAYIIPYGDEAQFQMGYKGFIQLAQRSGQYKTIAAAPVYEGQLTSEDPLLGNTYDWKAKESDKVIGYVSMFQLTNGFEKQLYMTKEAVEKHGKKYSKSYSTGQWTKDFESMALKTVIKLLISKFGPMDTEMDKAIEYDQSIVTESGPKYIDNESDVLADEDKKQAIIDANKPTDETSATESKNDKTPPSPAK